MPNFTQNLYMFTVAEDAPVDYQIGQVNAIDEGQNGVSISTCQALVLQWNMHFRTNVTIL